MEQWTIDGRESIAHTCSLISDATLLQADRFIAAHFSECKDTEWSDVSGGYRALFCKVVANSEQKSFTRMESSFEVRTKPPVYSEITVSYQYLTLSGLIVDDHTEYPLRFVCGAGEVTQAMEEACLTLSCGDCAVLVFDSRFGFRDEGLSTQHGTLGANDVGILYLHVHEMEIPLDDVQRRERATELKERANVAFRAGGDVLVVERLYDRALSKIGRQPYKGTNAAIRDADTVVRAQILANLQLYALLRNEYTLSIRRGEQLLKLDAVHEKGLYRLALAKYKLSQVEGACSVLEFLLAHNASCKEAEGLLQDIRTSASSQGKKALLFS